MGEAVNPKAYPLADAQVWNMSALCAVTTKRPHTCCWMLSNAHGVCKEEMQRHNSTQSARMLTNSHHLDTATHCTITPTQLSNTILDIVQQAANYKQLRKGANEGMCTMENHQSHIRGCNTHSCHTQQPRHSTVVYRSLW